MVSGSNFRHLNGTALHLGHESLSRPSVLITDCYNTLVTQPGRKQRDSILISSIMKTLSTTTSTILLPVESTTRILELAYLLDQHWAFNQLPYSLLWYTHTSEQTLNYAKSMLEWMGDAIAGEYSTKRDNPFDFKFAFCFNKQTFENYYDAKGISQASEWRSCYFDKCCGHG
jgi:cleavage and polyadenylation specificity factor subunit 2